VLEETKLTQKYRGFKLVINGNKNKSGFYIKKKVIAILLGIFYPIEISSNKTA
jgi:hypothetical protein